MAATMPDGKGKKMPDKMRTTTDTLTGKPFRWNDTVRVKSDGHLIRVPARCTARSSTHLHPDRVLPKLLLELNR